MTSACPYCGKPNQEGASFCLHCGRPFDEESLQELAEAEVGQQPQFPLSHDASGLSAPRARFRWRDLLTPERGLEFLLASVILVAVIAFAFYDSAQQEARTSHYRAGLEAEGKQDYELAVTEFTAAGDFRDAPDRRENLRFRIAQRQAIYQAGVQAADEGKWWLAASKLRDAYDLQRDSDEVAQLLDKARSINGLVVYRMARVVDGDSGLYIAEADGGNARRLPNTNALTRVHALSPDGRWLTYSLYDPRGRSLILHDLQEQRAYELLTRLPPTVISARFTADSKLLVVDAVSSVSYFSVPKSGGAKPQALGVAGQTSIPEIQSDWAIMPIYDPTTGETRVVMAKGPSVRDGNLPSLGGATWGSGSVAVGGVFVDIVATERGTVDGAVFSGDMRYLLYRTCTPPDEQKSFTCALRLLGPAQPYWTVSTIATIPVTEREWNRWALRGEFTRDGRHVLITLRYQGEEEVHLYNLDTGEMVRIEATASREPGMQINTGPLIGISMQGLQGWEGPNSLAYTRRNVKLMEAENGWSPRFFTRNHWVTVSPNNLYAIYLVGNDINVSYGNYALQAVPLNSRPQSAQRPVTLFQSTRRPGEWLPSIRLMPDGRTLLAVQTSRAGVPRGMYAYDLETGAQTLAIPNAVEMWIPGFASLRPQMLNFTSSRCDDC